MSLLYSTPRQTTSTSRTTATTAGGAAAVAGGPGIVRPDTTSSPAAPRPAVLLEPVDRPATTASQQRRKEQQQQYTYHASTGHENPPHNSSNDSRHWQHLYVLPVLLLEFLALALTRAVLPSLLLRAYGHNVYLVMGAADFVRGLLAFFTCPLFGRVSDVVGRRLCLLVTVLGTCAPVCSLALFAWEKVPAAEMSAPEEEGEAEPTSFTIAHPYAIHVFVGLLALSGVFSSTFTLVFAYISDTVKEQDERVSAYGLALATFGLSFTLGPIFGGYLAKTHTQYVFLASLLFTGVDLLYIYLFLPESRELEQQYPDDGTDGANKSSNISIMTMDYEFSWNPVDTVRIVAIDPFLRQVGKVAFLYYTGLWAVISTLSVYAVKRFHLGPERLGELISALGLCTMLAEAVLVRVLVPILGEKRAMKLGLVSFFLQCVVLGFAYESWHLFVCAFFSLLGNLVYPSLSSLVSGSVEPDAVGEALGALNGIKALTEGLGPLLFGSLMTISENSALPGWPYLLAAVLVAAAFKEAEVLPDIEEDEYVHELDRKRNRGSSEQQGIFMRTFASSSTRKSGDDEEELLGLLSEVDESWEDGENDNNDGDDGDLAATQLLPKTFAASFSPQLMRNKQ